MNSQGENVYFEFEFIYILWIKNRLIRWI